MKTIKMNFSECQDFTVQCFDVEGEKFWNAGKHIFTEVKHAINYARDYLNDDPREPGAKRAVIVHSMSTLIAYGGCSMEQAMRYGHANANRLMSKINYVQFLPLVAQNLADENASVQSQSEKKLDPDLKKLFDETPELTKKTLTTLRKADRELEKDPELLAQCKTALAKERRLKQLEKKS